MLSRKLQHCPSSPPAAGGQRRSGAGCSCLLRLGAVVSGRLHQRSAAVAAGFRLRPRPPARRRSRRRRRLVTSHVVEEAPAQPIVSAGSRLPAAVRGRPRRLAAAGGGLFAAAAVGADSAARGGHCQRQAAASACGGLRPPQSDLQRSTAATCLVQPGPWL